ncbi:substrate-binding periplasmic protein [Pseudodesulfovibrio sp.]|uniref:substrate-binding periplasmic protein n=1 Tax=unclassified Pseudodesulfovibrio TaxID=2661612 RepID=UPI003B0061DB
MRTWIRWTSLILLLFSVAGFALPGWCGERTVILTSLEWPPYTDEALPQGGACAGIVRAAFANVGYDVEIRYFPWKRAMHLAEHDPEVDGVFPMYFSLEREGQFLFSDAVGESPMGFAESVQQPVEWNRLEDLTSFKIGTVKGFVNTAKFDRMEAVGSLKTDASLNDLFNLRKVLARRVDLAVIDLNVFRYLRQVDPHLLANRHLIQINKRMLGVNSIYVCFRKGRRGQELLRALNEGLDKISLKESQDRYMEMIFSGKQ